MMYLRRVIPELLGPLIIQPVLLHGDLWVGDYSQRNPYKMLLTVVPQSGNTGIDRSTQEPVIFDPSSYFGHNEAE